MQRGTLDKANERAVTQLILTVRKQLHLTQEQMVERLELDGLRYYQALEYGERQPSRDVLLRVLALADAPARGAFLNRLHWRLPAGREIHFNSRVLAFA